MDMDNSGTLGLISDEEAKWVDVVSKGENMKTGLAFQERMMFLYKNVSLFPKIRTATTPFVYTR